MRACEVDFLCVTSVAGARNKGGANPVRRGQNPQRLDTEDVRKLGRLADAIPRDLVDAFIMFAKTDAFTKDELSWREPSISRTGSG